MKYLRKYNESSKESIIEELEYISLELKDEGFDFNIDPFDHWSGNFIIVRILPGENEEINNIVINTTYRVIDFMYQKSYDLNDEKVRIKRKVDSSSHYVISKEELVEFKDIDFEYIDLVFKAII